MNTRLAGTLAIAILAAGLGPRAQQAVFRTSVDSVILTVSVTERGRAVADLDLTDFEVRDNSVVQTLSGAARESLPIDVTFVVDLSGSVRGPLLVSLTRAMNAVGAQLRPADRAGVVTFNHRIQEIRPLTAGWPSTFGFRGASGQTSLFDALTASLIAAPESGRQRMAIVFTDGNDTTSFVDAASLVDVARRADTAVFIVALTEGSIRSPQRPAHEALFQALADSTGGLLTTLQQNQELDDSFVGAFNGFRTSYVLRYTYAGPAREGWHALSVRVTRRGVFDIRSRQGYFTVETK